MEDHSIPDFKKRLKKRMIVMLVIVLILFGGLFAFNIIRGVMIKKFFANFQPPPVTISSAKVQSVAWQPFIEAVGSVVAVNGVDVTSEVAGLVVGISFQSGDEVKKGDLLVQLDDRTDHEDLKNFQAQLKLAQLDFGRQSQLLAKSATAQQNLDSARATLDQMKANVARTEVLIDQKAIKAPFDGKLGIRQVNLGQYISPGTQVVTLQNLDEVFVDFSLPESSIPKLYVGQPVQVKVDAYGAKLFDGKITAINSKVDSDTRNVLVRATFPNPDHQLLPGMFGNLQVLLPTKENVLTVPQTAITYNLYGNSIYVIEKTTTKDGKTLLTAKLKYVTVGDRRLNQVAILKGVNAGDEIVTSGQLKLTDGAIVEINNSVDVTQFNDSLLTNPE